LLCDENPGLEQELSSLSCPTSTSKKRQKKKKTTTPKKKPTPKTKN